MPKGFAADKELARLAGRIGGKTTAKKYGSEYYATIGEKGGNTTKERKGADYFREIGRHGGCKTAVKNKTETEE